MKPADLEARLKYARRMLYERAGATPRRKRKDRSMGRSSKVIQMPPEHQARIDALLRRYQYTCIDLVIELLATDGISIARTTLHRYAKRLESMDGLTGNGPDSTVVVVIDLRTGSATQVRTSAKPSTVIAAIADLHPPALEPAAVESNRIESSDALAPAASHLHTPSR